MAQQQEPRPGRLSSSGMRLAKLRSLVFDRIRAEGTAHRHQTAASEENPYLAARRTWNEHVGSVASSRQTWQLVAMLSLLIALTAVGGMVHMSSQSRFVPYVVEVDRLGQAVAIAE